jgi:hypothetical protein
VKPDDSVKKRKNIISRIIDDQMLLLCPESNRLFRLNKVGTSIWELLDQHQKVDDLINSVGDRYQIERDNAVSDVLFFLNTLLENQLIRQA